MLGRQLVCEGGAGLMRCYGLTVGWMGWDRSDEAKEERADVGMRVDIADVVQGSPSMPLTCTHGTGTSNRAAIGCS